jgi:hypothetical protein
MDFGRITNVEVSEGMVGWIAIELKGDSVHAFTAVEKWMPGNSGQHWDARTWRR